MTEMEHHQISDPKNANTPEDPSLSTTATNDNDDETTTTSWSSIMLVAPLERAQTEALGYVLGEEEEEEINNRSSQVEESTNMSLPEEKEKNPTHSGTPSTTVMKRAETAPAAFSGSASTPGAVPVYPNASLYHNERSSTDLEDDDDLRPPSSTRIQTESSSIHSTVVQEADTSVVLMNARVVATDDDDQNDNQERVPPPLHESSSVLVKAEPMYSTAIRAQNDKDERDDTDKEVTIEQILRNRKVQCCILVVLLVIVGLVVGLVVGLQDSGSINQRNDLRKKSSSPGPPPQGNGNGGGGGGGSNNWRQEAFIQKVNDTIQEYMNEDTEGREPDGSRNLRGFITIFEGY